MKTKWIVLSTIAMAAVFALVGTSSMSRDTDRVSSDFRDPETSLGRTPSSSPEPPPNPEAVTLARREPIATFSNETTEPLASTDASLQAAIRPQPCPSGLTYTDKVNRILDAEARYRNAVEHGTLPEQIKAENSLAVQCAIAVMRERGDAQYELDVDDGVKRGFSMKNVPGYAVLASDRAKYTIPLSEFRSLELCQQRALNLRSDPNSARPLTDEERLKLEEAIRDALAALGIDDSSNH